MATLEIQSLEVDGGGIESESGAGNVEMLYPQMENNSLEI